MSSAPPDQPLPPSPSAASFPATRWTLVGRAGSEPAGGGRPALSSLLARYLPALRSHLVARRRVRPEQADELLQGFVAAKVLEQNLIHRADAGRGRFRSFLLVALDRYVIDEWRRAADPVGSPLPETEPPDDSAAGQPPSRAFDLAWARQVLDDAVARMRAECERGGRPEWWGVFEDRVLRPALDGVEPLGYDELVSRYALRSPAQASNALITAKRMFVRHLRATVGEYAQTPDEIEAELRDLWQAVRGGSAPYRPPPNRG